MISTDIPSRARTALAPDPIAFEMYDDDNAPVLCVDDGRVQRELHLELHNQSGSDIEFDYPPSPVASANNHHLELRFRPGTLSQRALGVLAGPNLASRLLPRDAQSWDVAAVGGQNGLPVSLFMLFKGTQRTLANDSRITLSLQELSAEAGLGSRPTQVQLKLRALRFAQARTPITSVAHRHLNVLHWGRAEAPLRAGFIGNSTLVNDGTAENRLRLRVINTSATETIGRAVTHARPSLTLSFDVGDANTWWTLDAEMVRAAIVGVEWPNLPFSEVHQDPAGGAVPRWTLDFPNTGLGPGQHVDITINGLNARGSGATNLYLRYTDIPGYRQGRLVCQMQRAPLNDEMLLRLYKTVFDNHASEIKAQASNLSAVRERITELGASHETLSADWVKWSGPKDDKGVPKLVRDVTNLKSEAHFAAIPINFSNCAGAYKPVGQSRPPYFAVVARGPGFRAKFGGTIEIPSLSRALELGLHGAMVLQLPEPLWLPSEPLSCVLTPGFGNQSQHHALNATFQVANGGTLSTNLYIAGVSIELSPAEKDAVWMVSLATLNAATYP